MNQIKRYWNKQSGSLSDTSLRIFGLLLLLLLVFISYRSEGVVRWICGSVAIIPLVGLGYLLLLQKVYALLMLVTWPIGWVMSYSVLGIVYFIIVTPLALFRRKKTPAKWVDSVKELDAAKMHE